MSKCYIEICYTYEKCSSFLPPVAIVEVKAKDGELIKSLADKAMNKLKEKYPDKNLYLINSKYLGDTLEIIPLCKSEEKKIKPELFIFIENRSRAEQCLIDNGIDPDDAPIVLQALGYILLDEELYPEEN